VKVSERLQALLVEQGLSVTDAAKRLEISRPSLSHVINGNAALSVRLALKIEREFGLNARKLLIAQLDAEIVRVQNE
jgi:addiction module HigA family antidote